MSMTTGLCNLQARPVMQRQRSLFHVQEGNSDVTRSWNLLLGNVVKLMRHKVKGEIICILALPTIPCGKVPRRISCSGIRHIQIRWLRHLVASDQKMIVSCSHWVDSVCDWGIRPNGCTPWGSRMCYNKSALKSSVAQILFSRRHLKKRPVLHLGAELSFFSPSQISVLSLKTDHDVSWRILRSLCSTRSPLRQPYHTHQVEIGATLVTSPSNECK